MDVYIRINKELSLRNSEVKSLQIPEEKNEEDEKKAEIYSNEATTISNRSSSFSAQSLFEFFETQKNKEKVDDILNKKTKNSSEINIPNFLNDKTNEIRKRKEILKQKEEKKIFKNDLKESLNLAPTLNNNYSEFGRGLFNEKLDLDLSEDEPYQIKSHKNSTDSRDNFSLIMEKDIKINEAIFEPIPEETFLCLD